MPVTKIGTCPCPQILGLEIRDSQRFEVRCPWTANVYEVVSGSEYKSVCSGTNPDTQEETGIYHEHYFGDYYLVNVTPL